MGVPDLRPQIYVSSCSVRIVTPGGGVKSKAKLEVAPMVDSSVRVNRIVTFFGI
jgi:hypothetical protein